VLDVLHKSKMLGLSLKLGPRCLKEASLKVLYPDFTVYMTFFDSVQIRQLGSFSVVDPIFWPNNSIFWPNISIVT
jgi:hypothetical protein